MFGFDLGGDPGAFTLLWEAQPCLDRCGRSRTSLVFVAICGVDSGTVSKLPGDAQQRKSDQRRRTTLPPLFVPNRGHGEVAQFGARAADTGRSSRATACHSDLIERAFGFDSCTSSQPRLRGELPRRRT